MKIKRKISFEKNKIIIYLLIFAVLLFVGIDVWLVVKSNKKNAPLENIPSEELIKELDKKIVCHMQDEMTNPDNRISYNIVEDYSFYVTKNHEMISDGDLLVLTFQSASDMNRYYDYLLNEVNIETYPNILFEKNEQENTITYKRYWIQGKSTIYTDEYLNQYYERGYTCQITNLNQSLEIND